MVCGGNIHGDKRVCVGGDGECKTEEVKWKKRIFSFLIVHVDGNLLRDLLRSQRRVGIVT